MKKDKYFCWESTIPTRFMRENFSIMGSHNGFKNSDPTQKSEGMNEKYLHMGRILFLISLFTFSRSFPNIVPEMKYSGRKTAQKR